jgi:hypothetical protein
MSELLSDIVLRLELDIERARQRLADLQAARAAIEPLVGRPAVRRGRLPSLKKVVARAAKARVTVGANARRGTRGTGRTTGRLPATGARFWLEILGDQGHTGQEIVDTAIARLGLGEAMRDKLYARASTWFEGAIERGLVVVADQRDGVNVYRKA